MTRIARRSVFVLMGLVAGSLAAPLAQAQSAAVQVTQLTDLVVEAVPIGEVFDSLAAVEPAWPVQEKPDAVDIGQLACLRDELSSEGYRRMKRTEVVAYVAQNPARVAADITVLESGAAQLMRAMMLAGVEQERTGVPVDEAEIIGDASESELENFMLMMTGEELAKLRVLLGIGDAFASERSAQENELAGEQAGDDLASRLMLKAMSNCGVPSSVIFQ